MPDAEDVCVRCRTRPVWDEPFCFECSQWYCFNCGNDLSCGLHVIDGSPGGGDA